MLSPAQLQARSHWQRAASLALVTGLHLLLLLAALQLVNRPGSTARRARELTFVLPRLPPPSPPRPAAAPRRAALPTDTPSPYILPPAPPIDAAPQPDIGGLGQNLFGCTPENLANLRPDQRARCPGGFRPPDPMAMNEPPSQVKDPARRAAEMAAKNRPFAIPCAMVMEAPAPYGATKPAPGLDPFCVLKGLIDGFGPLSGLAH